MLTTNKNILFIGPYRQDDGWGLASRDYLLSICQYAQNVKSQPIYLANNINKTIPKIIENCEKKSFNEYDYIIQHCLPFNMVRYGNAKNIGILFLENKNFTSISAANLNTMDELWVTSSIEKDTLINSGIRTPVKVIGHPIDTKFLEAISAKFTTNSYIDHHYKFYTIGEYIQRKNFRDIIIAFNLEFDITEPVSLMIKTSSSNPDLLFNKIKNECMTIKNSLRTKKIFHEELILTQRITPEQLSAIHNYGDCFITTSYGEAFCRPAAEALCHGNHCILSSNIGINEYIEDNDKSIIESYAQPVILDDPAYIGNMDIYNANEIWYKPSITHLQSLMRKAFENKPIVDKNIYFDKFSYSNIGQTICQHLL